MYTPEDISQIIARGIAPETITKQIQNFKSGFPFLKITEAASQYHGIIILSEAKKQEFIRLFEQKVTEGIRLMKFVPASGAASRMFKTLFSALEKLRNGESSDEVLKDQEVARFVNHLEDFAFYEDLEALAETKNLKLENVSLEQKLSWLLLEEGINYGNLPKGLLKFHKYPDGSRTAMEEQFIEGIEYIRDKDEVVNMHFTVSPEHQEAFEEHVEKLIQKYTGTSDVTFNVGFSQQKPSTDTLAVTLNNEPFRNEDGTFLFRPGGHGALIENLNELDADLIFIKNIDNVVTDSLKETTVDYKKALAGVLLDLQKQIFYYQKMLREHHPVSLESSFYAEAANFLENVLNITPPQNQYYSEKSELYHYLNGKFNRPIRVCGMVKNHGDPGGGPFFAVNRDGSLSLQIAETPQIDFGNPEQAQIARQAGYFNPVDLVCGVKNFEGKKYNLTEFVDPDTGFITIKSKDGLELKAQELPGLWNGSMSDWNTIFVEVPAETFTPVKTVNDLLQKEHQV